MSVECGLLLYSGVVMCEVGLGSHLFAIGYSYATLVVLLGAIDSIHVRHDSLPLFPSFWGRRQGRRLRIDRVLRLIGASPGRGVARASASRTRLAGVASKAAREALASRAGSLTCAPVHQANVARAGAARGARTYNLVLILTRHTLARAGLANRLY